MLILVQNDETRSKLDKIRAGPTQIDPRGSIGARNSEIYPYEAAKVRIFVFSGSWNDTFSLGTAKPAKKSAI